MDIPAFADQQKLTFISSVQTLDRDLDDESGRIAREKVKEICCLRTLMMMMMMTMMMIFLSNISNFNSNSCSSPYVSNNENKIFPQSRNFRYKKYDGNMYDFPALYQGQLFWRIALEVESHTSPGDAVISLANSARPHIVYVTYF